MSCSCERLAVQPGVLPHRASGDYRMAVAPVMAARGFQVKGPLARVLADGARRAAMHDAVTFGQVAAPPARAYDGGMAWPQFNHVQLLRYAGLFTYACVGIPLLRYDALVEEMLRQAAPGLLRRSLARLLFPVRARVLVPDAQPRRAPADVARAARPDRAAARAERDRDRDRLDQPERPLRAAARRRRARAAVAPAASRERDLDGAAEFLADSGLHERAGRDLLDRRRPLQTSIERVNTFTDAFLQSSLYIGICAAVFVTSVVAKQQAEAREDQRRLNSELRATRTLLAESSRLAERMRISRELHDLIGHHLTALSLNLEVASHLVQGQAQDHVRQAQSVAKLLLGDVREVVSQLARRGQHRSDAGAAEPDRRRAGPRDPSRAAAALLASTIRKRAQVLLRCAQEIITNTVRHAGARNLWLRFERNGDRQMAIHARDDGRGADRSCKQGNGLAGMRERLAQYGGRLDIVTAQGSGLRARTHGCRWSVRCSAMIEVCLVDDQTLVRQGIRSLLELSDSIRVVAEAGDGTQAIETIPHVKPDVVLLDMRMPGMSGLDVLNALAAKNQLPPTIILTTFDDDQLVLAGLKAGARGYLLKDVRWISSSMPSRPSPRAARWSRRSSRSACCRVWSACRTSSPASTGPIR